MMTAGQGQTVIDVALERSGSAQEAWALAVELGVSLTDCIEGTEVSEAAAVRNRRVARSYASGQVHPASDL